MSAIAGRVLILPKGDYDASVTYEFLDLVNHNSSSWLAKKASTGIEPSDANSEFWQKFGSSVTPDGVTIVIDENGVISAVGGTADKVTYENESVADVTNVKEALDGIFEGNVSALTTNLLKTPTTSENNGITCTNNSDGSLTFNGETTENTALFWIPNHTAITLKKGTYKVLLNPSAESGLTLLIGGQSSSAGISAADVSNSLVIEATNDGTIGNCAFKIPANTVIDNITVKPMLTTNLEATYDDFVPYTGNTGKLNGDVAEIRKTYFSPHNKPTGTYTGNGESAVRTIETNGTGSEILVWGKLSSGTTLSAIVLRNGTFYASNDATSPLHSSQMWKNDKGGFFIGSEMSTLFNVSGVQYEYAVL